jgi:hypothetical protein
MGISLERLLRGCMVSLASTLLFLVALFVPTSGETKLLHIKLAELVDKSQFIAVGRTIRSAAAPSKVLFQPKEILRGKMLEGGDIVLCNQPDDVESYDLRELEGLYVVFASFEVRCYRPVHGVSSVIRMTDGVAWTVGIYDQPESQPVQEFLGKVKTYLTARK